MIFIVLIQRRYLLEFVLCQGKIEDIYVLCESGRLVRLEYRHIVPLLDMPPQYYLAQRFIVFLTQVLKKLTLPQRSDQTTQRGIRLYPDTFASHVSDKISGSPQWMVLELIYHGYCPDS